MAFKLEMSRLLELFAFPEVRKNWERHAETCFAYWEELRPEQQDGLAIEDRLAAVWRAGVEMGSAAAEVELIEELA